MPNLNWPAAFVLGIIISSETALVWHGSLNAHALTATVSAMIGFFIGNRMNKGSE
jgi:uncharacterized membrane protein